MLLKRWLNNPNDIDKNSYLWNMTGSMLNAFQSVIMLMILTRTVNLYEAGLFTIAYANANLFLNIGKYGVRNFQVSDVNDQFSFYEYRLSRYITTLLMILVSFGYTYYTAGANDYPHEKTLIIIWMCLFKVIDSIEDVYHGLYQQKNRLDIAGRCMTFRMFTMILTFGICLIIFKRLLPALIVSTIATAVVFLITILLTYNDFKKGISIKKEIDFKHMLSMFVICFPLFLSMFLTFYIGNAPKYAIDANLSDELQAIYGFIAMPVFVITLLNNFIFNPIIAKLSLMWNEHKIDEYIKLIKRQLLVIVGISVVCEAGAFLLGIPVLSILYNTDLSDYKTPLLILLLGGGFLALSGLLVTLLTIMRRQNVIAIANIIVSIIALIASPIFVKAYGIMGASLLYLSLMVFLCIILIVPLIIYICREK